MACGGLVTQLRATRRMTELAKYTGELFGTLEQETGQATGFKRNGSLRVANTPSRYEETGPWRLHGPQLRSTGRIRHTGRDQGALVADQYRRHRRWLLVPHDGQVNPADVTMAYAKGARSRGARISSTRPSRKSSWSRDALPA